MLAPTTKAEDHPVRKTDEMCRLFSHVAHALAADATAIRQLTSMASISGIPIDAKSKKSNTDNNSNNNNKHRHHHYGNGENVHPNDRTMPINHEAIQGLRQLEKAVTSMEEKVEALREIVTEEKRALEHFRKLQHEADAQQIELDQVLTVIQQRQQPEEKKDATNANRNAATDLESSSISKKASNGTESRRDSVDPRRKLQQHILQPQQAIPDLVLERVSQEEFQSISKNTRGHISIYELNEALREIEELCHQKSEWLFPPHKTATTHGSTSTSALERRFEYLRQQRAPYNAEVQVDAHLGHYWVSEQELRETCALFRLGENTARATLSVLCALRRLKQVPGKNMEVTYIVLTK